MELIDHTAPLTEPSFSQNLKGLTPIQKKKRKKKTTDQYLTQPFRVSRRLTFFPSVLLEAIASNRRTTKKLNILCEKIFNLVKIDFYDSATIVL